LRIAWVGKGELGTLRSVEQAPLSIELSGDNLLAGFYINELLLRLAGRNDPHPNLFAHYSRAIGELADGQMLEPILRTFEIDMLAELGYGINLRTDSMTHAPLSSNAHYAFHPEEGPVSVSAGRDKSFPGDVLLAVNANIIEFTHGNLETL
jgi:DNA repair protein RecO (recombination protein O)